jgi:hypothetical protein
MKNRYPLTGTLSQTLCAAALMAPALRLVPGQAARYALRACWVSVLAAVPFILLDIWFLSAFLKNRAPGEGLREMLLRALGPVFGWAVSAVFCLWMLFYCAFILRSGAERFISTVYPSSRPAFFSAAMAVLGLIAALGKPETLARTAKVTLPVVAAVLILVFALSLATVELPELMPVTFSDALPVLEGAVPIVNVVCALLTYICFLEGGVPKAPGRTRRWGLWLVPVTLFLLCICVTTVGNFGGALTADLSYPFFAMVRNVRLLHTVERIEALVVTLWVLPDFVLVSMLLIIASRGIAALLGYPPADGRSAYLDMKNGRYIIPLCAFSAAAASVLLSPDAFALEFLSSRLVPGLNMALIFVLLPVCFAVGKLRHTI